MLSVTTLDRPVNVNVDKRFDWAFRVTRLAAVERSRVVNKFELVSSVTSLSRPVRVNDDN